EFRLRTSTNGNDGSTVVLASAANKAATTLQHVVAVRSAAGGAAMYVNGQQVATKSISGNFGTWSSSYDLIVGNESDNSVSNSSWQGDYRMVAVHCQALT